MYRVSSVNADVHEAEQNWRVPGVAGVTHLDGHLAPATHQAKAHPKSAPATCHRSGSRPKVRKPVYKPDFAAEEEEAHQKAQVHAEEYTAEARAYLMHLCCGAPSVHPVMCLQHMPAYCAVLVSTPLALCHQVLGNWHT